jgi:hypothetical protein
MKWTVKTYWFPYALSNLALDLARATNGGTDAYRWDSDRKLRIPMESGSHRVFEIKNHTTVVAWDEDGSGYLDQLLMATFASRMAVMSQSGSRRYQKK